MTELNVELYGRPIGKLVGTWQNFDFVQNPAAVREFGLGSIALSATIPMSVSPSRAGKALRQNFFTELLPEGGMLRQLADLAKVRPHDTIGILKHYGRDIAGALQIWDSTDPGEPKSPRFEKLTEQEVASTLIETVTRPFGNSPFGGKSSLAGVQDKIVLAQVDGSWARVLDGYPSTHILKPVPSQFPDTIYNEEFGSQFVRALGLATYSTEILEFAGVPALVIERYDRDPHSPTGRIHQEDFNQVLGASGNSKYQRYGGKVSLQRIAKTLDNLVGGSATEQLLRMNVLAVNLGNLDMHAKNISLLHPHQGPPELASTYDVVPQTHLPNDGEMALAIDGTYRHSHITATHLVNEGTQWGLPNAEEIVQDALRVINQTVHTATAHRDAHPHLVEDIEYFTNNLITGKATGIPPSQK